MKDLVRTSVGRLVMLIGLATAILASAGTATAQVVRGPLTNGGNHAGALAARQTDAWTVQASAGEAIVLSVAEVGADSPFRPWIGLYYGAEPNLTFVASSNNGSLAGHINVNVPVTANYTVYVRSGTDAGQDAETGNYLLTLAKAPGAFIVPEGDEGGPMINGANHPGYIHRGDQDQWSFVATAGETVSISIGEVGPETTFAPWIRLFGPNGAYLLEGYSQLGGKIDYTLPLSGTYTVVVADSYVTYASTGSYIVTLARASAPFVVPTNDDGGPMTAGVLYQAAITRADLDQWAFNATAGQAVTIRADEVGNSAFFPWLRLYGPTGAFIGDSLGPTAAEVSMTAPAPGRYTVVVASADGGFAASGYYAIRATGAGMADPPAIALGDMALNFGPSSGLWVRSNYFGPAPQPQWTQIHVGSPTQLARGDIDGTGFVSLIATFPGSGVWIWRQAGWSKLHGMDASRIITADLDGNGQDDIVLDFPGYGIWVRYNNTRWQQLHALDVTAFAAGNIDGDANRRSDLIATFAGYGVYAWMNNSGWGPLHALDGFDIRTGDFDGNGIDDVLMNFAGQGIWIRSSNGSWAQLHRSNSAGLTVGDLDGNNVKDLVVNFPGDGVWKYVGSTWTRIYQSNAPVMGVIDLDKNGRDDVMLDFTGSGVWLYINNTSYQQLHPADVTAVAGGRFDIN